MLVEMAVQRVVDHVPIELAVGSLDETIERDDIFTTIFLITIR